MRDPLLQTRKGVGGRLRYAVVVAGVLFVGMIVALVFNESRSNATILVGRRFEVLSWPSIGDDSDTDAVCFFPTETSKSHGLTMVLHSLCLFAGNKGCCLP